MEDLAAVSGRPFWRRRSFVVMVLAVFVVVVVGVIVLVMSRRRVDLRNESETATSDVIGKGSIEVSKIESLSNSKMIIRGESISLAGMIVGASDDGMDIERRGEVVHLPFSGQEEIYLLDTLKEQRVTFDDYSVSSAGPGVSVSMDNPISAQDLLFGDRVLVFFDRVGSNLVVRRVFVARDAI